VTQQYSTAGFRIVEPCAEADSYRAAVALEPVHVPAFLAAARSRGIPAMPLGVSCLLRIGRHIAQLSPDGTCSITRIRDVNEAEAVFAQAVSPLLTQARERSAARND
jgi:hypothetical protein